MLELRVLGGIGLEGSGASEAEGILRQPKRLAVLTYLAIAPSARFERRDKLLAVFWPELDEARARRGLRQTLHVLRAALGAGSLDRRGDAEVALNEAMVRCDAREVLRALDAGDWQRAVALYRGDLLPGFHLSEAPEFERWLETMRDALRQRVSKAAESRATQADAVGDVRVAADWLRRAVALAPDNELLVRQFASTLDRVGDRAGALQALTAFERRLRAELDTAPAGETMALAEALRDRPVGSAGQRRFSRVDRTGRAEVTPVDPSEGGVGATSPDWRRTVRAASAVMRPWRLVATFSLFVGAAALLAVTSTDVGPTSAAPGSVGTTRSAPMPQRASARLLYDQGMALWQQGDARSAERLMGAALELDSTYGLARLQLGHLLGTRGEHAEGQRLQREAAARAATEGDHDRLLILALFADRFQVPGLWAVAETLAIRYPEDLEGQLLAAKARLQAGQFGNAVAPLRRVAYETRTARETTIGRCYRCEGFSLLAVTYEALDSNAAVERTTRDWTVAHPGNADAWAMRAYQLATLDQYREALAALRRAEDIREGAAGEFALEEVLLRAGDFTTVTNILELRRRSGSTHIRDAARFLQWKSLREQGRYRGALALADTQVNESVRRRSAHDLAVTMRAQSLLDVGRPTEAVAVWDSLGRRPVSRAEPAASVAAAAAARLASLAAALSRAGDTVRLARVADSVQLAGSRSGWVRNQRLHLYVRGELSLARAQLGEACRLFTASLVSATTTFAAANLAAGRACLRAGHPESALRAARGILRGPIGAAGAWGTLTEAREIAGSAHAALGASDSAATHLSRVAEAWRNADVERRVRTVSPVGTVTPRLGSAATTSPRG